MKKYNIFAIIVLFLLIYEPPIFSFNILHVIGGVSWIYILFHRKIILTNLSFHKLFIIYITFIMIALYIAFISIVNNNSMLAAAPFLYWLIDIIPCSIMVNSIMKQKGYNLDNILTLLLMVGLVQSITAISAFFIPSIKEFFINQFILYGYDEIYFTLSAYRIYGFASNLTFTTPIVQSTLTLISVYLAVNLNYKYLIFTPFLFFSAVINARISFIIILVGVLAMLLCIRPIKLKTIVMTTIIGSMIAIIIMIDMNYIKENAVETYQWIITGINEIRQFFKGDTSRGYFNYVSNAQRYRLPDGFGLYFGVGNRIMGSNKYNTYSDIGYVNDIWLGGLIYCIFLYSTFTSFLLDFLRSSNRKLQINWFLFLLFMGSFIVSNIKGFIFSMNNFTSLFFIIYIYFIFHIERKRQLDGDE